MRGTAAPGSSRVERRRRRTERRQMRSTEKKLLTGGISPLPRHCALDSPKTG
jgi:hypothetical protein